MNLYRLHNNSKLFSFCLSALLFAFVCIVFGYWTDSYQHMYDTQIGGEFVDYNLSLAYNTYPEYMPGGAKLFFLLGKFYPIRWVAFLLYGVLFSSLWVLYYQVIKISRDYPLFSRIVLIVFLSLMFVESVALYHMVRVTMFAGLASMSFLFVNERNQFLMKRMIPYLLLFTIALWIRSNVHLFILIFVTGALILHKRPLRPLVPFWSLFSIFFLYYVYVVFVKDYSNDLNYFFLYNTEFKLNHVGDFKQQINLNTSIDSIKYQAIRNYIISDSVNLNIDYYNQIGILQGVDKISMPQFVYALKNFLFSVRENMHFLIADIILLFFYIFLGGKKHRQSKVNILLLFVFSYSIVLVVSFIKMESRFLVPFQVLFLYAVLILNKPEIFTNKRKYGYLLLFIIYIVPKSYMHIYPKIKDAQIITMEFKNGMEKLKENHEGETVVFNYNFTTYNKPFETFYQKIDYKKVLYYNYFSLSFFKGYRPYLEDFCKCDISYFYTFYKFLKEDTPETTIILDEATRIRVLEEYLKEVNEFNIQFVPTHLRLNNLGGEFSAYRIEK